jgi:outer membrane protein OmpA-like peptidoglycan-associated protein
LKRAFSGAALSVALVLGGCATRSVTLLPGEPGRPVGAVAVLNQDGSEKGMLDAPNQRVNLGGGVHPRIVSGEAVAQRYGVLIDNLPPPPKAFNIAFDFNRSKISADQDATVRSLFQEAASRPGAEVQVTGYTDTAGTDAYNDRLSEQRAEYVRDYLIQRGLPAAQVRATWRGKRELAVATPDNTPQPANRRVVVIVR